MFLRRLRAARKRKGLTQQAVADALGVPQSRISDFEKGQTRVDVIEMAELMALYEEPFEHFVPPRR